MKVKLDGFTQIEILVTLVISSIVILATYNGIFLAQEKLHAFKEKHENNFSCVLIDGQIRNESFHCDSLKVISERELLFYRDGVVFSSWMIEENKMCGSVKGSLPVVVSSSFGSFVIDRSMLIIQAKESSEVSSLRFHLKK